MFEFLHCISERRFADVRRVACSLTDEWSWSNVSPVRENKVNWKSSTRPFKCSDVRMTTFCHLHARFLDVLTRDAMIEENVCCGRRALLSGSTAKFCLSADSPSEAIRFRYACAGSTNLSMYDKTLSFSIHRQFEASLLNLSRLRMESVGEFLRLFQGSIRPSGEDRRRLVDVVGQRSLLQYELRFQPTVP